MRADSRAVVVSPASPPPVGYAHRDSTRRTRVVYRLAFARAGTLSARAGRRTVTIGIDAARARRTRARASTGWPFRPAAEVAGEIYPGAPRIVERSGASVKKVRAVDVGQGAFEVAGDSALTTPRRGTRRLRTARGRRPARRDVRARPSAHPAVPGRAVRARRRGAGRVDVTQRTVDEVPVDGVVGAGESLRNRDAANLHAEIGARARSHGVRLAVGFGRAKAQLGTEQPRVPRLPDPRSVLSRSVIRGSAAGVRPPLPIAVARRLGLVSGGHLPAYVAAQLYPCPVHRKVHDAVSRLG